MATFRENNITPMYVRNMYAMYRDLPFECLSVADLVCLARIGGVNLLDYTNRLGAEKSAFLIAGVVGGSLTNGLKVNGAEPFWNIWSTKQPGIWFMNLNLSDFTQSKIIHRLPRDLVNESIEALALFSLHDLNALAPTVSETIVEIDEGNTEVNVNFPVNYNLGNYDWRVVSPQHQNYRLIGIKEGYPSVQLGQSSILSLPAGDGVNRQSILTLLLSNNPTTYGTTTPTIGWSKFYICKSDGSEICELPNMNAALKLSIRQLSTYAAAIYINGSISQTNRRTGGILDQVTYPHDVVSFSAKKFIDLDAVTTYNLQSITINVREKSTGTIVFTYSRSTAALYYDAPKTFTTNLGGQSDISYELICDLYNSGFTMGSHGYECTTEFYYTSI